MENEKKPQEAQEEAQDTKRKLNFHHVRDFQGQAVAAFLVIGAAVLLYFLLLRIRVLTDILGAVLHALSPAIFGFAFAFVLTPAVRFFERQFHRLLKKLVKKNKKKRNLQKIARRLSVFFTLILVVGIIISLLFAIIPEFLTSISTLANDLPSYANSLLNYAKKLLENHPELSKVVTPYLENLTSYMEKLLSDYLSSIVTAAADWLTTGVMVVFRLLYNVLIGLIIAVYLLSDTEYYLGICKKLAFALLPQRKAAVLLKTMHKANRIYSGAILGKILDSAIIGLLCFIGTSILSIFFPTLGEYVVLVSLIVGITNVIPFFGPYIGGVPCTLLIMCIDPVHGLIFGVFLIVLQQFDCNYLDPHIVGGQVGLKPLFVLCACLLGGGLFGLVGMLLAVPTFALIYSLMKSYFEVRLEAKKLPVDTKEYVGALRSYFDDSPSPEDEGRS
ncbi:MAG: AI-2E family transporter [Lachnospiraceae bacterium]|nr:AI-2E family transporter [Lachnospiraceae bacterium]